jgi:hypothetical protein
VTRWGSSVFTFQHFTVLSQSAIHMLMLSCNTLRWPHAHSTRWCQPRSRVAEQLTALATWIAAGVAVGGGQRPHMVADGKSLESAGGRPRRNIDTMRNSGPVKECSSLYGLTVS